MGGLVRYQKRSTHSLGSRQCFVPVAWIFGKVVLNSILNLSTAISSLSPSIDIECGGEEPEGRALTAVMEGEGRGHQGSQAADSERWRRRKTWKTRVPSLNTLSLVRNSTVQLSFWWLSCERLIVIVIPCKRKLK